MTNLYLIFFLVGLLLFGVVVAYSVYQQKQSRQNDDIEPDFAADKVNGERQKTNKIRIEASENFSLEKNNLAETDPSAAIESDSEMHVQIEESLVKEGAGRGSGLNNDGQDDDQQTPLDRSDESARGSSQNAAAVIRRAKSAISALKKPKSKKEPSNAGGADAPSSLDDLQNKPGAKIEPRLEAQPIDASNNASGTSGEHGGGSGSGSASKQINAATDADSVITDLVARVLNPNPIEQSGLISLFREHDYKFHRKVHIYGLNELTDMWRDVEFELPTARFLELGISIQLCDREGAMNEKELHDFQQMVLQFCERYDAPFEFSMEIDQALKQAQSLDQIGRRYDSMAVLNVVPKTKAGFRMADIQSCARDLMMSSDKNGIFMKTEGQKNNITVLFRLACTDGDGHFGIQSMGQSSAAPVHDLVVYMNVPGTRDPEVVFQQMVKDANDLAVWLDGKVVDRSGKAMNQRTYSTLMQQISDIAYSMQQDGLSPGDAVAKKLF